MAVRGLFVLAALAGVTLSQGAAMAAGPPAGAATASATEDDGSAYASAGPAQFPALLDRYAVRPPWKVAGVDYAVGVPSGTVLTDPADLRGAGISVDRAAHLVRVTGNGTRLQGVDFSRDGGWGVYIAGANGAVIRDCLFSVGRNNIVPITTDAGTVDLTIAHSTIDGGGRGATGKPEDIYTLISYRGSGGLLVEFNWLRNAPQHVVEFKDGMLIYRNNLVHGMGHFVGAHVNTMQFNGSDSQGSVIAFNTIFNPTPGQPAPLAGGEFVQVEAQLGSAIEAVQVVHNTVIARGPSIVSSYLIAVRQSGAGNHVRGVMVRDNYLDISGAYGAFYPPSGEGIRFENNRSLQTGAVFPPPVHR